MFSGKQKSFIQRSPRYVNNPSRHGMAAHFSDPNLLLHPKVAQIADISHTGMRLIARVPTKTKIGDTLEVEFSLAGSEKKIKHRAKVVRKINEFVFAVRFIGSDASVENEFNNAFEEFIKHRRRMPYVENTRKFARWISEHRNGLLASLLGLLIIGGAGAYIYMNSDEHQNRDLRSWGNSHPKQWDWDYVKKFPQEKI